MRDLDSRGLPGVLVLTTEFQAAFALQCAAIGFAGAPVFVPHPVQNRTTAELHRMAEDAIAAVVEALSV
jgi:hypothetical protein